MAAFSSARAPRNAQPRGEQIASYDSYAQAQRAVDFLSDKEFPVRSVTIVGTDLKMVERITGRLNYPRAALSGAASGAWFGLFVGLLLALITEGQILNTLMFALLIGAGFGMMFGVIAYALTGGKRDFTSSSQVVASSFAVLCLPENAGQARQLLGDLSDSNVTPAVGSSGPPSGADEDRNAAFRRPSEPVEQRWAREPAPRQPAEPQPSSSSATEPTVTAPGSPVAEPSAAEPPAAGPSAAEPSAAAPSVAEPTADEPRATDPSPAEPTADEQPGHPASAPDQDQGPDAPHDSR